jgi:release factor glutamine methyltransferase
VCDLCTGCGCIAISLAKYAKCGNIVATDISEKALKTAQRNAISNGIAEKIEFRKADLFNGLIPAEKFDIIVCNPPYIRKKDLEKLPPEVRMEPLIALDGGEDGLDFYRSITSKASEFLKDNGILAMEMGDGQAGDVKKMFSDRIEFIRDLNGIDRVLIWVNKGGY